MISPTQDAERRLAREYEPLKTETLRSLSAKLRARGLRLPDEDLEDYYNQAWHALYAQEAAGAEIANTGGFLVQVAFRRAIDDLRRERRDERADVALEAIPAVEADPAERLDDRRMLREFAEALRDELGERERVAASLCYVHGYSRPEAARLMGLNERRMQKVMDKVSKAIGRIAREIEAGERCATRESANKAYALGLLDPDGDRYAAVRAHLDDCSRCRADVLGLRGLASVAPPALLPWAAVHAAGGAGGAAAKARHGARTTAAVATAAVVALAVAALAAFALTRGSSAPQRAATPQRTATATPSSGTTTGSSQRAAGGATKARSKRRAHHASRRRHPRAATRPVAAATPAAPAPTATPVPTATSAPPAPTVTPAPTATPVPTVIDDGGQEFGVER